MNSWLISIVISIAGFGILLISLLLVEIIKSNRLNNLSRHRSKSESVADLLNYAAIVDDGVIVCKNGALLASWSYECPDQESSNEEEKASLSARINHALAPLGNGWLLHIDAIRNEAPRYSQRICSYFPHPILQAIDDERRCMFEYRGNLYESKFILTLTYYLPSYQEKKVIDLLFDDDHKKNDIESQTKNIIENFNREIQNIESILSIGIKLNRLKGKNIILENGKSIIYEPILSHLQFCITGMDQPIQLPSTPMYLDAVIGGQELYGGTVPKIGEKFFQVITIEGFPSHSIPGILSALAELPVEYRWSTRFLFLDPHEAESMLDSFRSKWAQKKTSFISQLFKIPTDNINQDALQMIAEADTAKATVHNGSSAWGYYTSVIVIMDKDRNKLEENSKKISKAINHLGFVARIETINTMDAWLGSLPGHGVENVRRPLMHSLNLSDLLPTSSIWSGEEFAPCPFYPSHSPPLMHCVTTGSTPFHLNLHVRDVGHTIIFGPPGSGKSTLLCILAAQFFRYKDMHIFAFDKGMSMYTLCKASGGTHYEIGVDSKLSFCPLSNIKTHTDFAWTAEWIGIILELNGIKLNPYKNNLISSALHNMSAQGHSTLNDFYLSLQDESLREALENYRCSGTMGHIFDAKEDSILLKNFTVFEIEELMNLPTKYSLPILLYIFRRIEKSLYGHPAVIMIDEAWLALSHSVFREKIREWLKVLRKSNCIVIMATQNLSDAARSEILDVINETSATKIFLPNIYANEEHASMLYFKMGLNKRQIEIISQSIPKRQYYCVSEKGRRIFELNLGKIALAFTSVSDKESINHIKNLEDLHAENWINKYLKEKEISLKF